MTTFSRTGPTSWSSSDGKTWKEVGQHTWSSSNYTWTNIPFVWSDVPILKEVGMGGKVRYRQNYDKLDQKKKERVIELICTVNGIEYKESKTIHEIDVTVDDLEFLVESVKKAKVTVDGIQ